MPRTRHQCCLAARLGPVNCETVTVWSTTRGAEKVLESSIWMRYDVAALVSGIATTRSWMVSPLKFAMSTSLASTNSVSAVRTIVGC